jgi:hypothetical protein
VQQLERRVAELLLLKVPVHLQVELLRQRLVPAPEEWLPAERAGQVAALLLW